MKVSKLFHWLYGALMLLPLFAIVSKVLYVSFNKNAKDSYFGETINQVEYVSVESLQVGKNYLFNNDFIPLSNTNGTTTFFINNFSSNTLTFDTLPDRFLFYSWPALNDDTERMYLQFRNGNDTLYSYQVNNENRIFSFTLTGITKTYENTTYTSILNSFYLIQYNDYSYIDNVFYYSVNQLNNEPLFSWASDSFLSQPITYISNLFGMPSDSPLLTMLSYWLDISIIWLTFDLIMYVPLLVHRWIDKGILE